MSVKEKTEKYIMNSYGRTGTVIVKGSGRAAESDEGKKFIDFGSGIGTNSLGFCNEKWAEAIAAQAKTVAHVSNYYHNDVMAETAEKICKITGYKKLFFGNSGAEANECAIKLARKYSNDKYGKDKKRYNIITLDNSFHGRTMCTLSATGQKNHHDHFFPFMQGFIHTPANDSGALKEKLDDTICAVMIELIQGEGGVIPLDKDFVGSVFSLCAEKDILVIADEVQSGIGRTGSFLASRRYGVKPDITTLAKGIAGGLPMGVCLAGEKCADVFTPGTHGSTFGGNPVVCAAANVVLDCASDKAFLDEVSEKGEYIKAKLLELPEVSDVTGMGLMIGAELKTKKASDVLSEAAEKGLLVLTAKDKLRLLPPLNITYGEIDEGIKILSEILI